MAFLMRPEILRIFRGNTSLNGYHRKLERVYAEQPTAVKNSKYIPWATALVFHALDHLTHLTLAIPEHTLAYGRTVVFGAGTIGFPSLQSLTIADAGLTFNEAGWAFPAPCIWDSLLESAPDVSDVFIHEFDSFDGFFEQEANSSGNTLTSLVLNEVEIYYHDLQMKLQDFSNLGKFVCRRAAISFDQSLLGVEVLDATEEDDPVPLMTLLSELAATLHIICLPSLHELPAVLFGPSSFRNFRTLQNLWLDANFSKHPRDEGYGSTEPLQGRILKHLPTSLELLHLEGKPTDEDLSWLASNCRSRLPKLKELGLDATPAEILARVARNVSDVFFQSWTDFRGFSFIMNEYGSNITSLIFDDITIDYGDLVDMIEGAGNLEKFVCRKATVETDVTIPGDRMAPLLRALSQRAATLRTIVITSLE
ncbi:hypothetical protein GQ607_016360, partial [Colletotrichum asianum]